MVYYFNAQYLNIRLYVYVLQFLFIKFQWHMISPEPGSDPDG